MRLIFCSLYIFMQGSCIMIVVYVIESDETVVSL